MAIAKRNVDVNSDINVTPMVDVMLVLLIIFMVVTPMLQKGYDVDMAKTNNPIPMQDAEKEDALLVAVTRDGKVFFGNDPVSPEQITDIVKKRVATTPGQTVFVRADARARYGKVVEVVDDVRAAGIDQLGLLTAPRTQGQAPPAPTPAPTSGTEKKTTGD